MVTLLEKVARRANLNGSWNSIRHRATSKGLDQVTISDFSDSLSIHLSRIGKELRSNRYEFVKLRGHAVPKDDGEIRPLRIPAVRDRVVQKAIQRVIAPTLNRRYKIDNPVSFAYIKKKSVFKAVKRVRDLYKAGYRWIYVADIKKFFDSIPPTTLLTKFIFPVLVDHTIDDLIHRALSTEIGNIAEMSAAGWEADFLSGQLGIAQGGLLSPLFANVYLHPLDKAMIESEFEMVRYADDFVVMCRTEDDAKRAHALAKNILEGELNLSLHDLDSKKSKIERFNTLEFLGVRFEGEYVFPGSKANRKMVQILKELQRRTKAGTAVEHLTDLRNQTRAWGSSYFYTSTNKASYAGLDEHLVRTVEKLMSRYGLVARKRPLTAKDVSKLGVPSFSESVMEMRTKKKQDFSDFYA